jgi:hypothetical protein
LVAKWVSPQVSGGEERLYIDPSAVPERAQEAETGFMSPLDSAAAEALAALEQGDYRMRRDPQMRSAWSRFLMSLMMRMGHGKMRGGNSISNTANYNQSLKRSFMHFAANVCIPPMLPQRVDENLMFRKQSERLWKPASVRSGRKLEIDRRFFPSTSFGPLDAHTAMKYYMKSLSGRCVMVKTSVFQARVLSIIQ